MPLVYAPWLRNPMISKRDLPLMCRARKSGRRDAKRTKKMIALVRAELLRYHGATAKLNAAVRRAFPREHRVAKVMEMCSSGTINDAPGEI